MNDTVRNPLRTLAEFVADTQIADVPEAVRRGVARHFLDTIGVGIGGSRCPEALAMLKSIGASRERKGAELWGWPARVAPRNAALVNGVAAHALELDDTNGVDHSGAVVFPAIVAAAATGRPASGSDLVVAAAVGYDVGKRVLAACGGYESHNGQGWHSTGTCGPFAAAAGAARIMRLDAQQTAHALAIAASASGGLWAFVHDGAMTKKFHVGRAAEAGLHAALLATAGFTGPDAVFCDQWGGFLRTFAGDASQPEKLTEGLGSSWKLLESSLKPYASCRGTHSAIDALAHGMTSLGVVGTDIRTVRVHGSRFLLDMCKGRDITTITGAQMSLPYALASYLTTGDVSISALSLERRHSSAIADVMSRIELLCDESLAAEEEPLVEMITHDGRSLSLRVDFALGSPQNPMSDLTLIRKFRDVTKEILLPVHTDALATAALSVETMDDVGEVRQLLTVERDRT